MRKGRACNGSAFCAERNASYAMKENGWGGKISLLFAAVRHFDGIVNGVDKAQLIAGALAGQCKAGAVVNAGTDDGQT